MLVLNINKHMMEKNIKTKQLSEMTGIRWNTINDMAKNTAKHWSPDNLEKVMMALGIRDVSELIEWTEDQ